VPILHVVNVFVGPDGGGGNPLGVFVDGHEVPVELRQRVAADLGFSETVFVTDAGRGELRIHTPSVELPFAGHPLVGTAWVLARGGNAASALRPPAGDVATWTEADRTWIRGRADWAPPIELAEHASAAAVDALTGAPAGVDEYDAWAWEDEAAGRVRSRVFVPGLGIAEDEATGAAAVRLVTRLGRPIVIRQGVGSELHARPGPDGTAEVGGHVVHVDTRGYPLPR